MILNWPLFRLETSRNLPYGPWGLQQIILQVFQVLKFFNCLPCTMNSKQVQRILYCVLCELQYILFGSPFLEVYELCSEYSYDAWFTVRQIVWVTSTRLCVYVLYKVDYVLIKLYCFNMCCINKYVNMCYMNICVVPCTV